MTNTDLNDVRSSIDRSDCFSILYVNCRSIQKKYNNLLTTINIISPPIPIIAVSEIWTHDGNEDLFGLPGYNFVVKSRLHKSGGGVGIFLLGVYYYKLRDDLICDDVFADTVFIEIIPDNVVIECVYKPSDGDVALSTAYFDNVSSRVNSEKKTCYIYQKQILLIVFFSFILANSKQTN